MLARFYNIKYALRGRSEWQWLRNSDGSFARIPEADVETTRAEILKDSRVMAVVHLLVEDNGNG